MGTELVLLSLAELVGLVALMLGAGALVCAEMRELRSQRKRRKRACCAAVIVMGRKR
jgi:hypothetical protein